MGDLKEVTAGKSFDYEELLRSSIFGVICRMWIQVCQSATIMPSGTRMGIKFEIKNGEYIYTDKETGAKVDFFGAWALVLKRFDKKDDGPRTVAISRINEKLAEMRLDGK